MKPKKMSKKMCSPPYKPCDTTAFQREVFLSAQHVAHCDKMTPDETREQNPPASDWDEICSVDDKRRFANLRQLAEIRGHRHATGEVGVNTNIFIPCAVSDSRDGSSFLFPVCHFGITD